MVIIINTFRSLFSVHNCTAHINKYSSVIDYSPAVIIITYNISVPFLTWCMVHGTCTGEQLAIRLEGQWKDSMHSQGVNGSQWLLLSHLCGM